MSALARRIMPVFVLALIAHGCAGDGTGINTCRDGITDALEECDDGNAIDGDGCSAECTIEPDGICGDGAQHPSEECDDGNTADGDGCSMVCELEGVCGDGVMDLGEQCDDGNTTDGDGCSAVCTIEGPFCGDGNVDAGEECDDGNNDDGDGCAADCTMEQGTLAYIQANIFTPLCTQCHRTGGPGPFLLTSEQESYDDLVNVESIQIDGLFRVNPGDPEDSYLVHKVEGRATIGGSRMPPPPRPMLTDEQIDAIIAWISAGARR